MGENLKSILKGQEMELRHARKQRKAKVTDARYRLNRALNGFVQMNVLVPADKRALVLFFVQKLRDDHKEKLIKAGKLKNVQLPEEPMRKQEPTKDTEEKEWLTEEQKKYLGL